MFKVASTDRIQRQPPPAERARLREAAGITQARLAAALKTTTQSVKNWENGRSEPKSPRLDAYQRLLKGWAAKYPAPGAAPAAATAPAASAASAGPAASAVETTEPLNEEAYQWVHDVSLLSDEECTLPYAVGLDHPAGLVGRPERLGHDPLHARVVSADAVSRAGPVALRGGRGFPLCRVAARHVVPLACTAA
uniref:helix-turn-helix domain-containing protein n=1 Tax=Streptomyces canus TaxID=58343 RepID=UPI00384D0EDA